MTRNTKIFLGACLTSFALWCLTSTGIPALSDTSASDAPSEETLPTLRPEVAPPDIRAKAAFSLLVTPEGKEQVLLSAHAIAQEGDQGMLLEGQKLSVQEMLYPLLLQSSNDAAVALAEHMGQENFLNRMNNRAQTLQLTKTSFMNPNGLDPEDVETQPNLSSARDLAE